MPKNPLRALTFVAISLSVLFAMLPAQGADAAGTMNIVPWPKSMEVAPTGGMTLTNAGRIVAASDELLPLANVLSDEIYLTTALRLQPVKDQAKPGDIELQIAKDLKEEAYTVKVADGKAVVTGGSYAGTAMGTVTLLQAIQVPGPKATLAALTVKDEPAVAFRGLMLDPARSYHPMDTYKQTIELCRLYKVRYLQLHLSDYGAFYFPSKAMPKLGAHKPGYTWEQMQELEQYAAQRGVSIIPELEVPGHAGAMVDAMPELFRLDKDNGYTINFASPKVLEALDTLVGEMCEVFKSTPYFHIGGDEAILSYAERNPDFKKVIEEKGLAGAHDVYRLFLGQMNEMVKKRGKKMIVWEGFRQEASKIEIPKDIIVMEYESHFYTPDNLLKDGYTMINAAWTPLYVVREHKWPARKIYEWNQELWGKFSMRYEDTKWFQLKSSPQILGAEMCAWEQSPLITISSLRGRLPAMSERIWNPTAGKTYEDYAKRFQATDTLLERIIRPVMVSAKGLVPDDQKDIANEDFWFRTTCTLTMIPTVPGAIHYTLDGKDPTDQSPKYAGPITLDKTATVKAILLGPDGKQIGQMYWEPYHLMPISAKIEGTLPTQPVSPWERPNRFAKAVKITLTSALPGTTIRYSTDGRPPNAKSPACSGPVTLTKTTKFRAMAFDAANKPCGQAWSQDFDFMNFEQNITTGMPVTTSNQGEGEGPDKAPNAVDGAVDIAKYWGAAKAPAWLMIDLKRPRLLNKVHVFPFWGDGRHYQYTVEVSADAKTWKQVVDMSKNTQASTPEGHANTFDPIEARYIRVNMLHNSANPAVHLVEVRAYTVAGG